MKNRSLTIVLLLLLTVPQLYGQKQGITLEEFIFNEAPFKECHASTIAETPDGLVASWFGGTREKNIDVEIWLSMEIDGKWSKPVSVANGVQNASLRYPCWNPVLFQIPDGALQLYYKVGPSPSDWWGLLIESKDNGKTWGSPVTLPAGILGPIKNKPVLLSNGTLISPTSTENDGWRIHFEYSSDLGKTWSKSDPINDGKQYNAIQPSVLTYPGGKLQIMARSKENVVLSSWSSEGGITWTSLEPSGLPNPNSGTDAVTLNDGRQLIVYNHIGKKPNQWGGKRSPLNVAISKDGISWEAAIVLENEPGEFSYPAVIQAKDGLVHIVYTWKRDKVKHVVVDPSKIASKPILNEVWPE
ncbi:MAG: sialidase family protein [Cyclobacteriaceae bacterium]|nr:sialidase family protein [Cyclobacteriaceae bacterium]